MAYQRLLDRKRLEKGLTLEELGQKADLKDTSISRIINGGTNPRLRTIHKLADALECSPYEIGFDADQGGDAV